MWLSAIVTIIIITSSSSSSFSTHEIYFYGREGVPQKENVIS